MLIKIILAISFLFSFSLHAQSIDNETVKKIDEYVKHIQSKANIPAISIGVVQGNSLVYEKSYSKDKFISSKSLFYIGSLTKSFTALAVMQLVEEGKINLDDSIKVYLPWFKIQDEEKIDKITIRTLLNQTSGFSTYEGLKNFDDWDSSNFALEKTVRALENVSLVSEPSSTYHYSNINYQILGLVMEKLTGISYATYMKENVFEILDMKSSFASLEDVEEHEIVKGHRLFFGKAVQNDYPFSRVMLPAGYIVSNVEDMSKYLIAQMNEGSYKDKQILSPSMIKEVHKPSATVIKDKLHYSFGWFVGSSEEESYLAHLGSTPGYTSAMIIYPKDKIALIVLTNTSSYTLGTKELNTLAGGVIDIVKGKKKIESAIDIVSISAYIVLIGIFLIQLFLFKYFLREYQGMSRFKITSLLGTDMLIVIAYIFIVPRIYDVTFGVFLIFAPDIAYIMLGSIIVASLGFIVKSVKYIKSNKEN